MKDVRSWWQDNTTPSSRGIWLLGTFALTVVVAVACRTTTHATVWTDLTVGRAIWSHGIPRTDLFTFTGSGQRWLDAQWLFHAAAWALWRAGGPQLLSAVVPLALALAWLMVLWPEWRRGKPAALFSVALLMWLGVPIWQVSSNVTAMVPAAAMVLAARIPSLRSRLLLAFAAQILWTNLDPSSVAGPLLMVAAAVGDEWAYRRGDLAIASMFERRVRWGIPMLTALASVAQPYGWQGLTWLFEHREAFFGAAREELPLLVTWVGEASDFGPLPFYAVVGGCALGLVVSRHSPPAREYCLAGVGVALGTLSERWLTVLVVAVAPCLAWSVEEMLSCIFPERRFVSAIRHHGRLAVVLLLTGLAVGLSVRQIGRANPLSSWGCGLDTRLMPTRAAAAIREHGLSSHMYCSAADGAWLSWERAGDPVFADLRVGNCVAEQLRPHVWLTSREHVERELSTTWRLDLALLSCLYPSTLSMIERWLEDHRWQLVYFDGVSAILAARDSEAARKWADDSELQRMGLDVLREEAKAIETALAAGRRPPLPVRLIGAAAFYLKTGYARAAVAALELATRACPERGMLDYQLACARWLAGDHAGARTALARFLRRQPDSPLALELQAKLQISDSAKGSQSAGQ